MSERDKELSLVQHLGELRDRLMVASIAVIATTAISFFFATDIIKILLVPAGVHVLSRAWLARQRRYVIGLVRIGGAIITPPPDPFNQLLVAVPMYLLFEMGLFLARFAGGGPRAAS